MNFGRVGFVMEGEWSAVLTYDTLSIVLYEGAVYAAKRQSAGSEPSTHPDDWMLWVGSPVIEAEQTEDGYDLTISNGDGTTSVVHLLNGQVTEAELTTALSGLRDAFNANTAEEYNSGATYSEGDYCIHEGTLYRCTEDITTAEAWDDDHWEAAALADDIRDLSEELYDNKVDAITSSASGEIVVIEDGADNMPIKSMTINLEPVQSGSGDPSPSNVRPITGWTGVDVTRAGKNLFKPTATGGSYGSSVTWSVNSDGTVSATVTTLTAGYTADLGTFTAKAGVLYALNGCPSGGGFNRQRLYFRGSSGEEYDIGNGAVFSRAEDTVLTMAIGFGDPGTYVYRPMVRVASVSDGTFEPYVSNIYPISWQSEAGTVYGGSLDVTSGVLKATRICLQYPYITWNQYNANNGYKAYSASPGGRYSINQSSGGMSNMVSSFGSFSSSSMNKNIIQLPANTSMYMALKDDLDPNDVQVSYPLATPIVYQLTPIQIRTLLGQNAFWANINSTVDLDYRVDTKLYIEQLTKPGEDDMTANANIAAATFFMVGNRLFLSTAAISAGETIAPGTNCSEISLADALNQLNS